MIKVKINGGERELKDADPSWINEQIHRRRNDGESICVRIDIDCPPLHMVLSTPGCAGGGGGSRPPNSQEKEIFELWNKRHMNQSDFTGGNLVAFLKQLGNLVTC